MPKRDRIRRDNLARLISYILGHRPDEFGLVPDKDGFVTYKDLLHAIHEEPGCGYVKKGHIQEVLWGTGQDLLQGEEDRVRALQRGWELDLGNPSRSLPKILFAPVRRKAHPVALQKGLMAQEGGYLVLSPDRDMAQRMGRRRDQKPVLLEVMASAASEAGIAFYLFGRLFLTGQIPARFIAGPQLSREKRAPLPGKAHVGREGRHRFEAGTLAFDLARDPDLSRRPGGKKRKGWKEEARKLRRKKGH